MGGSGSAWIKPKKRTGLRTDAFAAVPHPAFARPGQRYVALSKQGRSRVPVRIMRVDEDAGKVVAQREDADKALVRLSLKRLLAAAPDGAGRHHRFVGHVPGRRYRTHACLVALDASWARLICPEWHPGLPIVVGVGAVPEAARATGTWLRCVGDLGATQGAHVRLHGLAPLEPGFDPARYHPIALDPDAVAPRPAASQDDDIVIFADDDELALARDGGERIYLTGHPPAAAPGARVYVHHGGRVRGWRTLVRVSPMPNGVLVMLAGAWQPVTVPAAPALPASGVASGVHGLKRWVARDWPRADEQPG